MDDKLSIENCLQEAATLRSLAVRMPEGGMKAATIELADRWEKTAEKYQRLQGTGTVFIPEAQRRGRTV